MSTHFDFPADGLDAWITPHPVDIAETDPLLCDVCTETVEDGQGWDIEDCSGGTHLLCRACYCANFL